MYRKGVDIESKTVFNVFNGKEITSLSSEELAEAIVLIAESSKKNPEGIGIRNLFYGVSEKKSKSLFQLFTEKTLRKDQG